MNIYLVERLDVGEEEDCFDFVCSARSEEAARLLHPHGLQYLWATVIDEDGDKVSQWITVDGYTDGGVWTTPDNVRVTLLGISNKNIEQVITFSYI